MKSDEYQRLKWQSGELFGYLDCPDTGGLIQLHMDCFIRDEYIVPWYYILFTAWVSQYKPSGEAPELSFEEQLEISELYGEYMEPEQLYKHVLKEMNTLIDWLFDKNPWSKEELAYGALEVLAKYTRKNLAYGMVYDRVINRGVGSPVEALHHCMVKRPSLYPFDPIEYLPAAAMRNLENRVLIWLKSVID